MVENSLFEAENAISQVYADHSVTDLETCIRLRELRDYINTLLSKKREALRESLQNKKFLDT